MPGVILPVKRPEIDLGRTPSRQRDLVGLRLYENKRQNSGGGFEMETKTASIPGRKRNFLRLQIQSLVVDVIQMIHVRY